MRYITNKCLMTSKKLNLDRICLTKKKILSDQHQSNIQNKVNPDKQGSTEAYNN